MSVDEESRSETGINNRDEISSNIPIKNIERRFQDDVVISSINYQERNPTQTTEQGKGSEGFKVNIGDLVVSAPPMTPSREYFRALQKWQGTVISVSEDAFKARLIPIVGDETEQEAEILKSDVTKEELELVQPGAIFYWNIGYSERPMGTRRDSVIRFRRLPIWGKIKIGKHAKTTKLSDLIER